jgi:predicted small lipoprotein YifL
MRTVILLFFVGICALNLSACGQKGPLYLPNEADEQRAE